MKPIERHFALSIALVGLLGFVEAASAFYHPGLQRWVNRDPAQELGFRLLPCDETAEPTEVSNSYQIAANDCVDKVDAFGLSFVNPFAYGNWCGPTRSGQGGPPIDQVDAACKNHDYCLATWKEFINPCKQVSCNFRFCLEVAKADCSKAPKPSECRQEKFHVLNICKTVLRMILL
jgi:hypothetical protein